MSEIIERKFFKNAIIILVVCFIGSLLIQGMYSENSDLGVSTYVVIGIFLFLTGISLILLSAWYNELQNEPLQIFLLYLVVTIGLFFIISQFFLISVHISISIAMALTPVLILYLLIEKGRIIETLKSVISHEI